MSEEKTVYFSGSAQLPKGTACKGYYDIINVGVEVNIKTGEILDIGVSLVSAGAIRFLSKLMIGHSIKDEESFNELLNDIRTRYFGHSQKAIVIALRGAYEKYTSYNSNIYIEE